MLKRHSDFFKSLMLLNDLLLVSLAWWAAYLIRFHTVLFAQREDYLFRHYMVAWLIILGVWAAVFPGLDLYRPRRISSHLREIVDLIKGSSLALLVFLAILVYLGNRLIEGRGGDLLVDELGLAQPQSRERP